MPNNNHSNEAEFNSRATRTRFVFTVKEVRGPVDEDSDNLNHNQFEERQTFLVMGVREGGGG